MPDPCSYDNESDFVSACIEERQRENPGEDIEQSTAVCFSMWQERDCPKTMTRSKQRPKGRIHKAGEALSVGEREAIFIASTDSPDRHGDIVEQNWDFRDFRKNPLLLFQHGATLLPIGRVDRLWTEDHKTYAHTQATPEGMDDIADKIWRFIKARFLNAVSVGFMPLEEPRERMDKNGRQLGWVYPKNSLLELSVVSVPANQEALAVARSLEFTQRDIDAVFEQPKGVSAGVNAARRYAQIERLRVGT